MAVLWLPLFTHSIHPRLENFCLQRVVFSGFGFGPWEDKPVLICFSHPCMHISWQFTDNYITENYCRYFSFFFSYVFALAVHILLQQASLEGSLCI